MSILDEKEMNSIVEKIVAQEIATKLGNPMEYVAKIITDLSSHKVDKYTGIECVNNHDSQGIPYMHYVATQCIKESIKDIIHKIISENQSALEVSIREKLNEAINNSNISKNIIDNILRIVQYSEINLEMSY